MDSYFSFLSKVFLKTRVSMKFDNQSEAYKEKAYFMMKRTVFVPSANDKQKSKYSFCEDLEKSKKAVLYNQKLLQIKLCPFWISDT